MHERPPVPKTWRGECSWAGGCGCRWQGWCVRDPDWTPCTWLVGGPPMKVEVIGEQMELHERS